MALRVVIDSNRLQSDELHSFLAVSAENFAVLTDYAWMEAYKGNSVVSIQKSMAVLRDFPEQVIVLKGTKAVSALDSRAPGIAKRMYWSRAGQEFHDTVAGLQQAQAGHPRALRQILEHGKSADRQMDKMLADMAGMPAAFLDMMHVMFTKDEIASVRAGKPHSAALVRKFFDMADYMALRFYKAHPQKPRRPTRRSRYDAFMYRFSMACLLYFLDWIREGSQLKKTPAKLRNDAIDINFATYGTYFNGVMSDDRRVRNLELQLRVLLEKVGARMPDIYIQGLIEQLEATTAR
jgi:hypothetical protein